VRQRLQGLGEDLALSGALKRVDTSSTGTVVGAGTGTSGDGGSQGALLLTSRELAVSTVPYLLHSLAPAQRAGRGGVILGPRVMWRVSDLGRAMGVHGAMGGAMPPAQDEDQGVARGGDGDMEEIEDFDD